MNPRKHKILLLYQLFIALIALISILLLLFDCAHAINLSQSPYVWIDRGIWAILVVDYFARLAIAKDKIQFFNENIWDLLSIIPTNSIFTLFRFVRVARVFHLLRVLRLLRLVGLTVRLKRFFHTDGLIYYLYLSCGILFIAAGMYKHLRGRFVFNGLLVGFDDCFNRGLWRCLADYALGTDCRSFADGRRRQHHWTFDQHDHDLF